MKLRGRETDKEKLLKALNACYKRANSKENFFELLKKNGMRTYSRGGKITGILLSKRKFRLKRLGFAEEKIAELNKSLERGNELSRAREEQKEKNINYER